MFFAQKKYRHHKSASFCATIWIFITVIMLNYMGQADWVVTFEIKKDNF